MASRKLISKDLKFPGLVRELLMSCESGCVAECCGLEAFEFTAENFRGWLRSRPQEGEQVALQFEALLREIGGQAEDLVSSDDLNTRWPKAKAVVFFSALQRTLKGLL